MDKYAVTPIDLRSFVELDDQTVKRITDVYATIQAEAAAMAASIARSMSELQNATAAATQQALSELYSDRRSLEPSKEDWQRVLKSRQQAILAMANAGWTWVEWIDETELGGKTTEELDQYFTCAFMADDGAPLKALRDKILDAEGLAAWRPLLADIFGAIQAGLYRVSIPSTITIIEGFIISKLLATSSTAAASTKPVKMLRDRAWHTKGGVGACLWHSGILFLDKLFAYSRFTAAEPSFINRHWILHGRSSTCWTLADALRLLHSLDTLMFLFEEVGEPITRKSAKN